MARAQYNERLDEMTSRLVRRSPDRTLGHRPVKQQVRLDLWAGDVVAHRDDHVVCPCDKPKTSIFINAVTVAGYVPTVYHIRTLALVVQVAATSRREH